MNKISVKIGILYIFLALLNMLVFTVVIYFNQSKLIAENTKHKARELADDKIYPINEYVIDMNSDSANQAKSSIIESINAFVSSIADNYILFTDKGELYKSSGDEINEVSEFDKKSALTAIKNKDFQGDVYYSYIDEEKERILFYIPLGINLMPELVLKINMNLSDLSNSLNDLYRLIIFILIVIAVFHIAFGVFLNFLIIRPIKKLQSKSNEISGGNLDARVKVKSSDEIGLLGRAFNSMADHIKGMIDELREKNNIMEMELDAAGTVQKAIYPTLRDTPTFSLAVHNNPLEKVSGDFHDIVDLGDGKYGVLIADVSGHGVPAALVTMRIKDTFARLGPRYSNPRDLFVAVNTELQDLMDKFSSYFTGFYITINKNYKLEYASAGHPKMYLLRSSTKKIFELNTDGFIIGVSENMNTAFTYKTASLKKGDRILLFTDGIPEAKNTNNQMYDDDGFLKSVKKHYQKDIDEMLVGLVEDLRVFVGSEERRDDETILVLEVK